MSYRGLSSPAADRDLALIGLLAAVLAILIALSAALVFGAVLITGLLGGQWRFPGRNAWLEALFSVLNNPAHPEAAFGQPWASTLTEQTSL
jgi:hypothetical protein